MARTSLPPGFRFHPTDVELVMYYLKRKNLGKLKFEAIAEVNIYKYSPWDLPGKSCLKSKDLEWFFFCPREKKYASGLRVKRATENGYWKTTGKDRPICYKNEYVGTVKTLIFHSGHAPKGERTDWVIHEYRILDSQLVSAGFQETFVLCKVFKKSGPGPKNGAQYGAPFDEADWAADDVDDEQNQITLLPSNNVITVKSALRENSNSAVTSMFDFGSTSGISMTEVPSSSAGPTDEMNVNELRNEIVHSLSASKDDQASLNDKENDEDGLTGNGDDNIDIACFGLDDADNEDMFVSNDFFAGCEMEMGDNSLNAELPLEDVPYLELDDFLDPVDCSAGISGTQPLSFDDGFGCSHGNTGLTQCVSCINHILVLPESPKLGGSSDTLQFVNDKFYQGQNHSVDLDKSCKQPQNRHNFTDTG